jgi:TPR repeat protein
LTALERKAAPPSPQTAARAGLYAAGGAVAFAVFALAGSMGFLRWRDSEQRRVLAERSDRCKNDDATACDALRQACLKRSGDGCVALSEAYFASGPNHDAREALRLLSEACTYRMTSACIRGAKLQLIGDTVPRNPIEARSLLERGCEFGDGEACSLRNEVH